MTLMESATDDPREANITEDISHSCSQAQWKRWNSHTNDDSLPGTKLLSFSLILKVQRNVFFLVHLEGNDEDEY